MIFLRSVQNAADLYHDKFRSAVLGFANTPDKVYLAISQNIADLLK